MGAAALHRLLSLSAGTLLGLPPQQVIDAAAAAGFAGVGLRWAPEPPAAASVHEVRRSLDASGLTLLDVEVVRLRPGVPVVAFRPLVEAAVELGARFLLAVSSHPAPARTAEEDLDRFRRMIDIHVIGCFLGIRGVARRWADEDRAGAVVNVSSVTATHAVAGQIHYVTAKGLSPPSPAPRPPSSPARESASTRSHRASSTPR